MAATHHDGANGHVSEPAKPEPVAADLTGSPSGPTTGGAAKKRPKKKGPNYNQIHKQPLPLSTHPLPAFHPTNPISLLRLAYAYLSQILAPPSSHPSSPYVGYFSPETRSVHVTDPQHVRALWEMGFFGKGTLSRSEPSWLEREKAKVMAKHGGGTAEEATNARREKRRLFKLERARAEAEKIERQRLVEEGKLDPSELEAAVETAENEPVATDQSTIPLLTNPQQIARSDSAETGSISDEDEDLAMIENQEHLQLTMEEAFFLSYGLGVLSVLPKGDSKKPYSNGDLLVLFVAHSHFPPKELALSLPPDDPFLLSYITYHHFRSLGWVVRHGVKFSVDYLLYVRGPAFTHAEFAVMIMPSYSDSYWGTKEGQVRRRIKEDEQKDWWWLHCINRVQGQVLKTLILVYVEVPAPDEKLDGDVGRLLRSYTVREFAIRRWVANRSRD